MNSKIQNAQNILIIRLSSLGDALLTIPVIKSLKRNFSDKNFSFVINKNYADAIRFNPYLKSIYEYDKNNPQAAIEELKKQNFDFVIDLQNNRRSKKITRAVNLNFTAFKKPTLNKFLLVNFKINRFEKIKSIPELYAGSIDEKLAVSYEDFEFFLPDGKAEWKPRKNKICICPGAQHFTKRYPVEYFIEFSEYAASDGFEIVALGGSSDKQICAEISEKTAVVKNKSVDDDLFALAREMQTCEVAICNDSGLMHLATAIGVPVIAIFGSSVKEFGFAPFTSRSLLLENNSLSCKPCSHIGRESCPKGHFKCMKEIKPKYLFEEFKKFRKKYV